MGILVFVKKQQKIKISPAALIGSENHIDASKIFIKFKIIFKV